MANPEHVELVKRGARAIRAWRELNPDVRLDLNQAILSLVSLIEADLSLADLSGSDLSGANLGGAYLSKADLSEANLNGANLSGANLSEADLSLADLSAADLSGANLVGADLSEAGLSGANFREAGLSRANLSGANLREADLSMAMCWGTDFGDVNLSETIGLELIQHLAPSVIGVPTLYKSRGKIPEEFLRGCGVPDGLITYLPSLLGIQQPFQFYSCFISYSSQDEDFCKRLHSRMRDEKLRVWFAPKDMKGGDYLQTQIDRAIELHDRTLLVISESSLQSEWVKREVRKAIERGRTEKRKVLFPIRLVDYETIKQRDWFDGKLQIDLVEEIGKYYIPDFSNWKDHDAFELTFMRLLSDLKASALDSDK